MKHAMEFDRMRMQDVAQVAAIERDTFAEPWSVSALEAEVRRDNSYYAVLRQGDTVLAYGGFWKVLEEGQITNIAVRRELRGKGLGDLLVKSMKKLASSVGVERMTLEVRVSNTAAQRLYEKNGFVNAGRRPGFYGDGEDAYIYWTGDLP